MEQTEQVQAVLVVPPAPPRLISPRTLRRIILSSIVSIVLLINTIFFGSIAAYRFSTNSTSKLGQELISQYYVFTELEPCAKREKSGINPFEHRGYLMIPLHVAREEDDGSEDDDEGIENDDEGIEKPGNKPTQKPDGGNDDGNGDGNGDIDSGGDNKRENKQEEDILADVTRDISTLSSTEDPTNFDIYKLLFPNFPDKQHTQNTSVESIASRNKMQ